MPPRSLRAKASSAGNYEYGTTVRFYDAELGAWRSTWMGPMRKLVLPFVARRIDDEIVLETRREDGTRMRWIFSEVTSSGFRWRSESETGMEWEILQKFEATRMKDLR